MTPLHPRHRLLLSPSPEPRPMPSRLDNALTISFAATLCAVVTYLTLDSVLRCIHHRRQRRQQEQNPQHPPARSLTERDQELRSIPVQVYDGPEAESCSVCLAEYEAGEEVRVLPRCGHMFHRACVDRWLITRSSFCPVCRDRVIRWSVEPAADCCSNSNGAGGGAMGLQARMEIINATPVHLPLVL